MSTLFTLTVDTEEEWDWNAGWPVSDLSVANVENLPKFQQVCSRHGVAPTYFVDLAVMDDDRARQTVLKLDRWGKLEIGMHIHPWNTPPLQNSLPVTARDTFLHNLDADLILAKLNTVYDSFEKRGLRPTSFRGGRYSSGRITQQFLQQKGFVADASVVPYVTWNDDGAPDYRDRDLYPSRLSPAQPEGTPLWEIPLTLGFTRRPFRLWATCFEKVERTALRKLRLIGIAERVGLVSKVWLNFEDTPAEAMLRFLNVLRAMQLPCVCFTVHSSSLMAGKNAYTPNAADEERIFAAIDQVLGTVSGWPEFRSATMSEVAKQLEDQHNARLGN